MSTAPSIALLRGERVLQHVEFSPHLILKHLKTTMILTDTRLHVSGPNTIFGFVPHGYHAHTTPLESISDVQSGMRLSTRQSTCAALTIVVGFVMLMLPAFVGDGAVGVPFALILFAVGAGLALSARKLGVVARTFGGGTLVGDAGSADMGAVEMMQNAIFLESMNARARHTQTSAIISSPNIPRSPDIPRPQPA